jgi:acyl-coenzyme A synthetase/AMP-(fatty) acid ligase
MTSTPHTFDLVAAAAEAAPTRPAIVSRKTRLTFSQLLKLSRQLAQVLRRRGVHPGDIVGVGVSSFMRCVVSVAASHEGLVTVPLSSALVADNYIGMTWTITGSRIPDFPIEQQIIIDREMLNRLRTIPVTAAPRGYESDDALFRIAMSSGTTGRPKAIPLTVRQNHERALESIGRWGADGRFMSLLFPKNGAGWHAWHTSLFRQQPYLVPDDPIVNIKMMAAGRIQHIMGSPTHLASFVSALEATKISLPDLRSIQSGGSRLTPALVSRIKSLTGLEVGNTYSSTEFGGVAFRNTESDDPSYMGQIYPDIDVEIVEPETHTPVPDGDFGVLRLRRPGMISGYLFNEDANADHFRDGWFYPGDTAKIVDGGLYLGARETEIINAGGVKVDPTHIDSEVAQLDGVADVASFKYRNEFDLEGLGVAYVVADDADGDLVLDRITTAVGKKVLVHYVRVDAIPRNEWGKILRAELTERYSANSPA